MTAVRWCAVGIASLLSVLLVAASTDLRLPAVAWWVALGGTLVGGAVWLAAVFAHNRAGWRDHRVVVLLPPVVAGLAVCVSLTTWPYEIRWSFEQTSFEAAATSVLSGTDPVQHSHRKIGTRDIESVRVMNDRNVVFFDFAGSKPLTCEDSGIAYAEPPLKLDELEFYPPMFTTEIGEGWWRYEHCN